MKEELFIALFLFWGSVFLYFGAEFLIRGATSLALRIGLPLVVIGLTIMGYGTGTPELVVSIQASLGGKGDIALGNVIGSNIANIGLVLGFTALCRPISVKRQLVRRDVPIMVVVSFALCLLFFFNHNITRWKGLLFFLGFLIYTVLSIYLGKKEKEIELEIEEEKKPHKIKNRWIELGFMAIGFLLLFLGGKLFLDGSIALAKKFHISDAVIGLTVIALGTSLPEFATSVVAVMKRHEDIVLGNIVGSNIFNILAIVGIAALIHPIQIVGINWIDYTFMTLLACFFWLIVRSGSKITRWEGALFLLSYVGYITYLVSTT
ncbi:MAG: Inner membrane protein YrbG [Chlamydiae bacterium]|nr:Inner membrane protein YrbG [Chlamydiota bacterium]